MQYLKTKAHKIFKVVVEWELYRLILKYIIKNLFLPVWLRQYALISLAFLPLHSSTAFAHVRCIISNQSRSVLTFFKLNRFRFKFLNSKTDLTGIKKSMW